jgi:predicted XRE-type DNA-binding protein
VGVQRANRALVQWRLADLRLKQKHAAEVLRVSEPQFTRLLAGDRTFSDDQLETLSRLLGMDVSLIAKKDAA